MHTSAMPEQRRRLRRLILSADDLWQARRFAKHILDNQLYREEDDEQRIVGRGMQMAAVVSYSRPFSGNYEFEHTVGKLSDVHLDGLTKRERVLHDRVLRLRHKAFAHSDADVRDLRVDIVDLFGSPTAFPSSHNPFKSLPEDEWRHFLALIEKVRASVASEVLALQNGMAPGDRF